MIAESTLLCAVGSTICLEKRTIIVIPLRCHDREHLAALKRHFDYVLVGKADGTLGRKFICYEYVHPNVESGSRAI
jgi:hypothetical protein